MGNSEPLAVGSSALSSQSGHRPCTDGTQSRRTLSGAALVGALRIRARQGVEKKSLQILGLPLAVPGADPLRRQSLGLRTTVGQVDDGGRQALPEGRDDGLDQVGEGSGIRFETCALTGYGCGSRGIGRREPRPDGGRPRGDPLVGAGQHRRRGPSALVAAHGVEDLVLLVLSGALGHLHERRDHRSQQRVALRHAPRRRPTPRIHAAGGVAARLLGPRRSGLDMVVGIVVGIPSGVAPASRVVAGGPLLAQPGEERVDVGHGPAAPLLVGRVLRGLDRDGPLRRRRSARFPLGGVSDALPLRHVVDRCELVGADGRPRRPLGGDTRLDLGQRLGRLEEGPLHHPVRVEELIAPGAELLDLPLEQRPPAPQVGQDALAQRLRLLQHLSPLRPGRLDRRLRLTRDPEPLLLGQALDVGAHGGSVLIGRAQQVVPHGIGLACADPEDRLGLLTHGARLVLRLAQDRRGALLGPRSDVVRRLSRRSEEPRGLLAQHVEHPLLVEGLWAAELRLQRVDSIAELPLAFACTRELVADPPEERPDLALGDAAEARRERPARDLLGTQARRTGDRELAPLSFVHVRNPSVRATACAPDRT